MQGYSVLKGIGSPAAILAAGFLFACAGGADSTGRGGIVAQRPLAITTDDPPPPPSAGRSGEVEIVSTVVDARPAALVNGRVVQWGELRPLLNEAAGAMVLQEVILDRVAAETLVRRGLQISDQDVEAERQMFLDTLSEDADLAVRLADEVRARQGLGPQRFQRLMRRNAMLRALVRSDVRLNKSAIQRMYQMVHGPKRQGRLMILPGLAEAQAAIERLGRGESFGDVAVQVSTDSSAARGGLLEPISRADLSYPEALRQALWSLESGEISSPVLLDHGYAVLRLVREIQGDGADPAQVRPELERLARRHHERLLMDQLARQMLFQTSVTIFDKALQDNWRRQRRKKGSGVVSPNRG